MKREDQRLLKGYQADLKLLEKEYNNTAKLMREVQNKIAHLTSEFKPGDTVLWKHGRGERKGVVMEVISHPRAASQGRNKMSYEPSDICTKCKEHAYDCRCERPGIPGVASPVQGAASAPNDCTEPNRAACPRLCMDFCNKAEEAAASASDRGGFNKVAYVVKPIKKDGSLGEPMELPWYRKVWRTKT